MILSGLQFNTWKYYNINGSNISPHFKEWYIANVFFELVVKRFSKESFIRGDEDKYVDRTPTVLCGIIKPKYERAMLDLFSIFEMACLVEFQYSYSAKFRCYYNYVRCEMKKRNPKLKIKEMKDEDILDNMAKAKPISEYLAYLNIMKAIKKD